MEAHSALLMPGVMPGGQAGPMPPPLTLRKGKWSHEEEQYSMRIIHYFNLGCLRLPEGTTLRAYLAERLNCDPMRITKKFTGSSCLGKRVYHGSDSEGKAASSCTVDAAAKELAALEAKFRARICDTMGSVWQRVAQVEMDPHYMGAMTAYGYPGMGGFAWHPQVYQPFPAVMQHAHMQPLHPHAAPAYHPHVGSSSTRSVTPMLVHPGMAWSAHPAALGGPNMVPLAQQMPQMQMVQPQQLQLQPPQSPNPEVGPAAACPPASLPYLQHLLPKQVVQAGTLPRWNKRPLSCSSSDGEAEGFGAEGEDSEEERSFGAKRGYTDPNSSINQSFLPGAKSSTVESGTSGRFTEVGSLGGSTTCSSDCSRSNEESESGEDPKVSHSAGDPSQAGTAPQPLKKRKLQELREAARSLSVIRDRWS